MNKIRPTIAASSLHFLSNLLDPQGTKGGNGAPNGLTNCNAHIHLPPNFSAFANVEDAIRQAGREGIGILGANNYYDFEIYGEFSRRAFDARIMPLFGVEVIVSWEVMARDGVLINDPANPGKMYLCGKGITKFDKPTQRGREILTRIKKNDRTRMEEMVNRLNDICLSSGLPVRLSASAIAENVARRGHVGEESVCLQERHLAAALQQALDDLAGSDPKGRHLAALFGEISNSVELEPALAQNEIRSRLLKKGRPAFVQESFIQFDEAMELISELGGIPCYPVLADGANPICHYERDVDKLTESLLQLGIRAVEFIPARNRSETLIRYVRTMRKAGLIVTAGTEHNTNESATLRPTCADGDSIPEDLAEIFLEGARVYMAHQYLAATGQTDVDGQTSFKKYNGTDTELKIERLSSLGAKILHTFRNRQDGS